MKALLNKTFRRNDEQSLLFSIVPLINKMSSFSHFHCITISHLLIQENEIQSIKMFHYYLYLTCKTARRTFSSFQLKRDGMLRVEMILLFFTLFYKQKRSSRINYDISCISLIYVIIQRHFLFLFVSYTLSHHENKNNVDTTYTENQKKN